jgi:hypothetical protein
LSVLLNPIFREFPTNYLSFESGSTRNIGLKFQIPFYREGKLSAIKRPPHHLAVAQFGAADIALDTLNQNPFFLLLSKFTVRYR